ncbi:MAG TPA: membrane dipeptidase, partial [Candidatus Eisenbacteria bacterium]|nr:membrane dipeptidase [Candidatus Eisenbacteria bacterium]
VSAANAIPYFPDAATGRAPVGMSERGREVIQEMERLGMVVDVTHVTREGLDDILRAAKGPLIASHSGPRTLSDHPYNLVDEHVQEIARRNGLIGVLLCPYLLANYTQVSDAEKQGGLRDVSRAFVFLRQLLAGTPGLGREPHACLAVGTDFGGYIPRIKDMSDVSEIELLRASLADELGRDPSLAGRDLGPILDAVLAENVIRFLSEHWGRSR